MILGTGNLSGKYQKDLNGNSLNGRVLAHNTKDSIIRSEDKLVVGIGLENIVIVETKDAVLVANTKDSQSVKNIVSLMKEKRVSMKLSTTKLYIDLGVLFCLLKMDVLGK